MPVERVPEQIPEIPFIPDPDFEIGEKKKKPLTDIIDEGGEVEIGPDDMPLNKAYIANFVRQIYSTDLPGTSKNIDWTPTRDDRREDRPVDKDGPDHGFQRPAPRYAPIARRFFNKRAPSEQIRLYL
jgi:hypothetical protein